MLPKSAKESSLRFEFTDRAAELRVASTEAEIVLRRDAMHPSKSLVSCSVTELLYIMAGWAFPIKGCLVGRMIEDHFRIGKVLFARKF